MLLHTFQYGGGMNPLLLPPQLLPPFAACDWPGFGISQSPAWMWPAKLPLKFDAALGNYSTPTSTVSSPPMSKIPQKATTIAPNSKKQLFRPWIDEKPSDPNQLPIRTKLPVPEPATMLSSHRSKPLNSGLAPSLAKMLLDTTFWHSPSDMTFGPFISERSNEDIAELLATKIGKTPAGHQCIYCGKLYSRKYGLKIHLRTHTGFKPLSCSFCHRAFGDPSNLNKHKRLHAAEGDSFGPKGSSSSSLFKCMHCGKCLGRKRDLDRHVSSRHTANTAPFKLAESV